MTQETTLSRKEQIEAQLRPLIGLKLSIARLAADMRGFHFGEVQKVEGGSVGEYALHIQGPWRIETTTEILTGRTDLYRWKYDANKPYDWTYESGANLQEAILARLLEGYDPDTRSLINSTDLLVVEGVEGSVYGDARISLSGGYTLSLWPDTEYSESWRIFEPRIDKDHFVIGDEDRLRGFEPATAEEYLERAEAIFEATPDQTKEVLHQLIEDCEAALRLDSNNSMAYCRRGKYRDLLDTEEDTRAALADYTEAIRLDPNNFEAYMRRTLILIYDLHDHRAAIADFTKAIGIKPKTAFPYADRAASYHALGDYEAALDDLNHAITLKPTREAYIQRSKTHQAIGNMTLAFADLDAAIEIKFRGKEIAYRERGNLKWAAGDVDGAIADYALAIGHSKKDAATYNERAWRRYLQKDYPSALADANLAVKYDKDDSWRYLHTRGAIYAATAQVARAICDYQQALDLEPDDPETQQEMIDYIARWVRI
jgi:tetratricopeptide (TPR) repeat protein